MLLQSEINILREIQGARTITPNGILRELSNPSSNQRLYVILRKLEKQGLITRKMKRTGRVGAPEKRVSLTKKGKTVMRLTLLLEQALAGS